MGVRFLAALAALLCLPMPVASAGDRPPYTLTITVTPSAAEPGDTVRVTAPSPPPNVVQYYGGEPGFRYDVLLTYTTTSGSTGRLERRSVPSTRIDETFTIPDDAKRGTTAVVSASLDYVTPGGGAGVGTDTAPLLITFPPGPLVLSTRTVPANGSLLVTGGRCESATYAVRHRSGTGPWSVVAKGAPAADGTFRASIPASSLKPGAGEVTAVCAGTYYPTFAVRVLAAAAPAPRAPRAPAPLLPRTGPADGILALAGVLLVAAGAACLTMPARRTAAAPARGGRHRISTRP